MSSYNRGVLDGVVHYCDVGWSPKDGKRQERLYPWCLIEQRRSAPAERAPKKRAVVTCLQCLYLRRYRP